MAVKNNKKEKDEVRLTYNFNISKDKKTAVIKIESSHHITFDDLRSIVDDIESENRAQSGAEH